VSRYRPTLTPPPALSQPRWLCGCGASVDFWTSKAYPICQACGQRMTMLDSPELLYARDAESDLS
jgi:hypothetical protein